MPDIPGIRKVMFEKLRRQCPACQSAGISIETTIAAAVDSDSRCVHCGVAFKYGSRGRAVISVSFFAGLFVGLLTGAYWIGIATFLLGICSLFLMPLQIDKLDPMSLQRETRRKIAAGKTKRKF